MKSIGNVSIEHGKAMKPISSVRVANMLDAIIQAKNIPVRYAYTVVLFIFSNIKSPVTKINLLTGINLSFDWNANEVIECTIFNRM